MNDPAPEWLVQTFTVTNGFIALAYGLLAIFFIRRTRLPSKEERNPLVLLASVGAFFFFVGCAHTHIDLMIWSNEGQLQEHWYSWWNVLSHLLQGLGGFTFWALATFYLKISIFDKRHYDKVTSSATKENP